MPFEPSGTTRSELFALLLRGHETRLTVLTPNRRLAQSLLAEVDGLQLAAGRGSWEAPDILMFSDFVKRCHDEALYSEKGGAVPAFLRPAEEQILWEAALAGSDWRDAVLSIPATAALAARAWQLAHDWRIENALRDAHGNEDSDAFSAWREAYERRTASEHLTDAARLPGVVGALLAERAFALPSEIVLYAFDLVTPQQSDLLEAFARAGVAISRCGSPSVAAKLRRAVFDSPRQELEHAARWARSRLEAGAGRIAVVVPDIEQRRAEVARVFARVLGSRFNLSLGETLSEFPMVDAALGLLELAMAPVAYDRVSRLIRSPFIHGAETEMTARARLDAELRRLAPATITLGRMRALIPEIVARRGAPPCPRLREALGQLEGAAQTSRAAPHEWARRFTTMLDAAGFPGERSRDSTEFQTLAKWREVIAELATLGSVSPTWNAGEARSRLQRLCTDTLFQAASQNSPVQVLGILESSGLPFDHLWVSGLTEEAWPLATRPHPLIPPALQRTAGIPQAAPEKSLAVDRALTEAWSTAAPEVMFTSARADGDRELLPSPLIVALVETPVADLAIPAYPSRRAALFAAGRKPGAMTMRADPVGPPIGTAAVQGGTAILADQAACPFRAFAHFRLDARSLERPESGLGPAERGQLLHAMMAKLWSGLRDHATLVNIGEQELGALIEEAAAHAVARVRADRPGRLEGRFAELERERLAGIAHEWLEIERARPPFEVRMSEQKMTLFAGNLKLEGRVDRIDHLESGGLAVIDYKSGPVTVSAWLGDRPDDAQLPLYVLAAGEEQVHAVAFARLKTGHLGFTGLARENGLLPDVCAVEDHRTAKRLAGSWAQLEEIWRHQVERLGEDFASGDARVDPKRLLATCERCDLKPLCRVHERLGSLAEGPGVEDEE
jgi:ATP-dependent helicase/nuclease subunit B